MTTTIDEQRAEDEKLITDFVETTTYDGEVDDWEEHLLETAESEDEPEV